MSCWIPGPYARAYIPGRRRTEALAKAAAEEAAAKKAARKTAKKKAEVSD